MVKKNQYEKISKEFPEYANLESHLEINLDADGVHPQNVPEKVLGTSSILIGATFDALFCQNFYETMFIRCSSRAFCSVWRNGGKKK